MFDSNSATLVENNVSKSLISCIAVLSSLF